MLSTDGTRSLLYGTVGILLIAGGITGAATAETAGPDVASTDTTDLGDHHLVLEDATVTIADTHITGPGLPERSVDRAEYTVDTTAVSTDGFVTRIDGHEVRVGAITVRVDNVGVVLEDVSTGEPDP